MPYKILSCAGLIITQASISHFAASAKLTPENIKIATINQVTSSKAQSYFASGVEKYNKKDYQGALTDFDRTIQIDPKLPQPYNNRGLVKSEKIPDYNGALADFNQAIQIDSKYFQAYNNRGSLKMAQLRDYQGALSDFSRAIQINVNYANAYANRSTVKYKFLNDKNGATLDLQQAIILYRKQGEINSYQEAVDMQKKWEQKSK